MSPARLADSRSWRRQALRYGVVGVSSNLLLYTAYLGLTTAGLSPVFAMSIVYACGVAVTFVLNGRWSFGARGLYRASFARYVAAYAAGYVINLVMLSWLVHRLGLPHAPVQGFVILLVAAFLFLAQRYWVFAPRSSSPSA